MLKSNNIVETVVELLTKLNENQLSYVEDQLEKVSASKRKKSSKKLLDLLRNGPVLSTEAFKQIKENRENFSLWREK